MLTLKFKIKSCSNEQLLSDYISSYTHLFYKLYNNAELIADNDFILSSLSEYIDKSIYDFCVKDVLMRLNQKETSKNKKTQSIKEIQKELLNKSFLTKKEKYRKYKLINKLSELKRNLNKDITFGGKELLKNITRLSQNKSNSELLEKYKKLFKENRKLGIFLIGRANEKGNRKVNFNLNNNEIIFKPNGKTKINLTFYSGKKQSKVLSKLQQYSELKLIPLTTRIDNNYIYISYDEELLNGFSFKNLECKAEQKLHINVEVKKNIYITYKTEQQERKSKNKLKGRYLAVDLNPKYIGLSILDKKDNGFKIIYHEAIDLSKLSIKLNHSSSNSKQLKQNNKRKHEIKEVWKYIFNLCKHYKIYNFVMEDLKFKSENVNTNNKEFNKQTKNLWYLTLTNNLINKYCNEIGLNLIEVNPIYTSFIGNMIYNYFDPISSSIEICRRGINKYIKGSSIYPELTRINQEKLTYLLGENVVTAGMSWKQLYDKISVLRYRNPMKIGLTDKYLYSRKSKVKLLT